MKRVSKTNSKLFVEAIEKFLSSIGATKIQDKTNGISSFELESEVGKLSINIEKDNVVCYTVYSRFEDPKKASEVFDCNSFSGKYNIHVPASTELNEAIEEACDFFEMTLPTKVYQEINK